MGVDGNVIMNVNINGGQSCVACECGEFILLLSSNRGVDNYCYKCCDPMAIELPPDVDELPLGDTVDVDVVESPLGVSHMELPADVDELPPDVLDESDLDVSQGSTTCSCKLACHSRFSQQDIEEVRFQYLRLPAQERTQKVFTLVLHVMQDKDGSIVCGHAKWTFKGERVCRSFWEHVHCIAHKTLVSYMKCIRNGALAPPVKLAPVPPASAKRQFSKADAWFLMMYNDLAEPMATADPELPIEMEDLQDVEHPLWSLCSALGSTRSVPRKYLNPGGFEDLWLLYQVMTPNSGQASRTTLFRAWSNRWENYLRFRNIGQGKRCKICARLDEERTQAADPDERASLMEKKKEHIAQIMADREVGMRATKMAERDAKKPSDGRGQLLRITIDGMDQSKFKVPRNLASTAEFESLWRPQLHVVGAIAHGHLEAYFLMDADLPKDANMNCTVIGRVLELVKEKIGPQHALPRNMIVNADNTTRESKNQHFMNFLASMVSLNKFETTELQFLQTGHTHNEQDQRFSTVALALSRAPVLEDTHDFAAWIRANVKPVGGRVLHVEVLDGTYDFQQWFTKLDVCISGLAATSLEPDTNHVWRFIPSSLAASVLDGGVEIEVAHDDWKGMVHDDSDAVLLLKQYMHSENFSQVPLLVQPKEIATRLKIEDLSPALRNELGERTVHEFRKTARALATEPWNLFKAQAYLETLCDRNCSRIGSAPPALLGFFQHKMTDVPSVAPCPSTITSKAPSALRRVHVDQRQRSQKKRPAASSAARAPGPQNESDADGHQNLKREDHGSPRCAKILKRPTAQIPKCLASASESGGGDGPNTQPSVMKRPMSNGSASEAGPGGKILKRPSSDKLNSDDGQQQPTETTSPALESAPVQGTTGCSKCRWSKSGCAKCRDAI
jgi:hypothetical protein